MRIDKVDIYTEGFPAEDMPEIDELKNYIAYVRERIKEPINKIIVKLNPDKSVDIDVDAGQKFERIRRITGYLVGTIDRWNNAKQSEERERVKHDLKE